MEAAAAGATQGAPGPNAYVVVCNTRSLFSAALDEVRDRIARVAEASGAAVRRGEAYPGWAPNESSPALAVVSEAMSAALGGPVKVSNVPACPLSPPSFLPSFHLG